MFSPHLLLPGFNFIPEFSVSFPPVVQDDREWGLWSVHPVLSLLLLLPQGGLLTLLPYSSVGSLPEQTVLHELLQT